MGVASTPKPGVTAGGEGGALKREGRQQICLLGLGLGAAACPPRRLPVRAAGAAGPAARVLPALWVTRHAMEPLARPWPAPARQGWQPAPSAVGSLPALPAVGWQSCPGAPSPSFPE